MPSMICYVRIIVTDEVLREFAGQSSDPAQETRQRVKRLAEKQVRRKDIGPMSLWIRSALRDNAKKQTTFTVCVLGNQIEPDELDNQDDY